MKNENDIQSNKLNPIEVNPLNCRFCLVKKFSWTKIRLRGLKTLKNMCYTVHWSNLSLQNLVIGWLFNNYCVNFTWFVWLPNSASIHELNLIDFNWNSVWLSLIDYTGQPISHKQSPSSRNRPCGKLLHFPVPPVTARKTSSWGQLLFLPSVKRHLCSPIVLLLLKTNQNGLSGS